MIHELASHIQTFVNHYLPSGKAFAGKHVVASNMRKFIEAICEEFVLGEMTIEEFKQEMMPDSTTEYITYWERVVGIPDHCFQVADNIVDRRLNVKRKLSLLGLQTRADFEGFAAAMGIQIKVRSGVDHLATDGGYGTELPAIPYAGAYPLGFGSSIKTARFTVVVTSVSDQNAFDYDFDFPFQTAEQALMECVFKHAIPANCQIIFAVG